MIIEIRQNGLRRSEDSEENNRQTRTLKRGQDNACAWSHIQPGHIVVLRQGEVVPADVLLLYSEDTDNKMCLVDHSQVFEADSIGAKFIVPVEELQNTPDKTE